MIISSLLLIFGFYVIYRKYRTLKEQVYELTVDYKCALAERDILEDLMEELSRNESEYESEYESESEDEDEYEDESEYESEYEDESEYESEYEDESEYESEYEDYELEYEAWLEACHWEGECNCCGTFLQGKRRRFCYGCVKHEGLSN